MQKKRRTVWAVLACKSIPGQIHDENKVFALGSREDMEKLSHEIGGKYIDGWFICGYGSKRTTKTDEELLNERW